MKRLIIDVTCLAHWQGELTGIPRVINELVVRYMEAGTVPIFVVWDNPGREFYLVDMDQTLRNRGKSLHYLPANSAGVLKSDRLISFASRALLKLKAAYRAPIPDRVVSLLTKRRAKAYQGLVMRSGDTLFIPMGEWHNQHYIDMVVGAKREGVRLAQVCYDVLPLVQPQFSGHATDSMNNYNTQVMPLCNLVLSISENTKKDLTTWLKSKKLHVPPIEVFRLGDDFKTVEPRKPADDRLKKQAFILCVGTVEARKNHTLLYYAYKLAHSRGIDLPRLVVVGRKGWRADNIFDIASTDPEVKDKITFLTAISDEELSWLYANALFSVYPSFYEGWGLPVAESVMHGLPCACSRTSSIPEIAGDMVHYFDPASPDECLASVQTLMDPVERSKAKAVLAKYKPTSWTQAFNQVDKHIGRISNL